MKFTKSQPLDRKLLVPFESSSNHYHGFHPLANSDHYLFEKVTNINETCSF